MYQLDGSNSFSSLLGNGKPTFFWQQLSGPVIGQLSGRRSSPSPLLTGSYVIRLTVTDALGQRGLASDTIGAIATDADGRVITGDAILDKLLGPLTRSGTSPWPYYDIAKALGETIATAALANPPTLGEPFTGTVPDHKRARFPGGNRDLVHLGILSLRHLCVGKQYASHCGVEYGGWRRNRPIHRHNRRGCR